MSFANIPIGEKAPEVVNAVIEIPKGSHNKYEYDEKFDEIRLDRVLHSPLYYPADYGFIPQTRSEDGDHLDILVIISDSVFTGCVLTVRPIGVLDMEDESGQDSKIIAVAEHDPRQTNILSIDDIDEHFKNEICHFFEQYKKLEHKWVKVREWSGKEEAFRIINESALRFAKEV
jgi:inorganic pyrophosphatase